MGILTNSEDPDEMVHDEAFHQGVHCEVKKIFNFFFENIT